MLKLDDDGVRALMRVLIYLADDEQRHYEADPRPDHVWLSIERLMRQLDLHFRKVAAAARRERVPDTTQH